MNPYWKRACSAAIAFLLLVCSVLPARAQSNEVGTILITVTDAAGHLALADARVLLVGPTVASALTTRSGIVKYTDVPSGIYRVRVVKRDFTSATSEEFQVSNNREIDVAIELVSVGGQNLKVIGSVTARPNIAITSRDVDENSAIRKISDSLTDALGKIAGVSVNSDSNDPNAAQTISLRGKDESQTAVTLDGIPLGAPGAATNLRSLNTDLFSGASTSFSPSAGGLGGGVNFRTLQPTQTWQERFNASYGTYDKYNYQVGVTGSVGKLGIAALHTDRGGNNQLTFQNFQDSSGLTYPHGGESVAFGDFAKLRYSLGERTTMQFSAISNNTDTVSLCTQYVTLLPCGIGPGNSNRGKFGFTYGSLQTLIGEVSFNATAYTSSQHQFSDDINRYVNGVASPSSSDFDTLGRGVAFSATISPGRHTIVAGGSTYASRTTFTPIVTNRFVIPSDTSTASQQAQISDSIKASDKITLGDNVSYATTVGVGRSFLGGVSAGWRPTAVDGYNASVAVGSSQPGAGLVRTLSDPAAARFNCYADTATVSGPGDLPAKQSSINYDATWTHQTRRGAFSFSTYRQTQAGQLINAQVLASSEPAGYIPSGYSQLVNGYWNSAFVCGAGATNPTLYVNESIGNTTRQYQGFDFSGRFALGPNVSVFPTYSVNTAVVTAADARLNGLYSTTVIGDQIPGRPVHRGGLTLDAQAAHFNTEILANAQYTGSNNGQHIAPYVVVNAGLSHPLGAGRLTFFASNLFNTEIGAFSTLTYAQPETLNGGGQLLVAGNPNTPRQYTVTFSFNTGNRNLPRSFGAAGRSGRASAGVPGAGPPAAADGAGGPGAAGGNQVRGRFRFVPPPAGVDPLTLAATREECTAEYRPFATPLLVALRADVAAYTAGQAILPSADFTVTGHGDAKAQGWYLEIRPQFPGAGGGRFGNQPPLGASPAGGGPPPGPGPGPRGESEGSGPIIVRQAPSGTQPTPGASPSPEVQMRITTIRSFVSCSYITALKHEDAVAKGFKFAQPGFGYAPGIGLFFAQPPTLGTGGGSVK